MLQVTWIRFFDPPFTLTMVERVLDHRRETGELALPDWRPVALEDLGEEVRRAAVSSEDARFFLHGGFDWEAICEAWEAYTDDEGGPLRGGSTISQQVARNVFLWQGRSWLRKGLEAWYTVWLELLVPKERILELYLNVAETGPMTFGMEAAAWRWYKRPAARLTREEAARIAAILPSPRHWRPTGKTARRRAAWILDHPAPFPGDPLLDEARAELARDGYGPLRCRR